MTPVYQSQDNDCLRAAVASLLGLEIGSVPHFVEESGPECWVTLCKWCGSHGIDLEMHYDSDPGILCIAAGLGPRGRRHIVVWHKGLVHDPHPSGAGLVGAPDYYATLEQS